MKYYTPEFEIELFEVMDVITASEPVVPANNKPGEVDNDFDNDIDWSAFGL